MSYEFDFLAVLEYWPLLVQGAITTLQITAISTVLGIILGSVCAGLRTSHYVWARRSVAVYVEIIRNTPLLIQAYFLIFGLSSLGIRLPFVVGATLALTVNVGAYTTEIVRAGIQSIRRGQIEAAECLGLSRLQIYLNVIIRPALERVYPALTSQYVLLMLFSSIVSAVGVDELFGMANRIQSETFRNFEIFVVLGVIYVCLAALVRLFFWALGLAIFPRRRRLGTPL